MVSLTLNSTGFTNIEEFMASAHKRKYPKSSTIIYAGEESESIYYIIKGSVTVLIDDSAEIVAYLNEGDFEKWPCLARVCTAWVKAKTTVAELANAKFVDISQRDSGMLYELPRNWQIDWTLPKSAICI